MSEEKSECVQEDIKANLLKNLSDSEKYEWETKLDRSIKDFLKWIKIIEITKSNKEQTILNLQTKIKMIMNSKKMNLEGLSLQKIESYFNALKKLIELKDEVKFNSDLFTGYIVDITEYIKLIPLLMYAEKYPNPNVIDIKRFARFFLNITRSDKIFTNPYHSMVNVILLTELFLKREFTDIANITNFARNYKIILSDEEVIKLSIYKQSPDDLRKEIENAFWEAEDYKFCDGKISLIWDFIDFNDISTFDTQKLSDFKECFNNFKTLFDNPTDLLRRALLTKGDYTIWVGYSKPLQRNKYSFINEEKGWKEQLSPNNHRIGIYKSLIKDFGDRKKINNTLTTDDILNQIITDFLNNKTEEDWVYHIVKDESILKNCKEEKLLMYHEKDTSPDFPLKIVMQMQEEEGGHVEKLQGELNFYKALYASISRKIGKLLEIFTEAISKNGIKHEFIKEFTEVIEELSKIYDPMKDK